MRSSDSLRNTKVLEPRCVIDKNSGNFEGISSGKYWAQKVNQLGIKEHERQAERINKLGGQTLNIETKMIRSKVSDQPGRAVFGVATYRASKDSSLENETDSFNDTLERASNPDT